MQTKISSTSVPTMKNDVKTISMRPEDLYKFPRTRSSTVTCLSYGKNRKTKFPGYFFCHGCDLLEDAILSGNKRANREQRRYTCTGGHEGNRMHPTTMPHQFRPNNNKDSTPKVNENHSSDEDRDHKMPRCAEYATPPTAHTKSSPTKSPLKKKVRRSQRLLSTFAINYAEGGSSTSSDKESSVEDAAIHQQFATALSFLDDDGSGGDNDETEEVLVAEGCNANRHPLSAAFQEVDNEVGEYDDDSVAQDVIEYISDIEKKNVVLTERLCEVERSMGMQITALETEIADLNAKLVMLGTTCKKNPSNESEPNDNNENDYQRKKRIDRENAEISKVLSGIIRSFLMTSGHTANKRRFPSRRLARILVDSVNLTFEWISCELADATHSFTAKLSHTTPINEYTEHQQSSFGVSLLALLNRKCRRCTDKRKAAILVDCLWDDAFLDGEAQSSMIDRVCKYVRSKLFTPWRILKAMDLAGFNLSLAGIEVLRGIDGGNKYNRGFLPSKSSILRAARKVEANADALCPFTMIGRAFDESSTDDVGEGFEFDVLKTTKTLFEAFGLMEDAKHRSVELGLTSDGAQLTHTLSHVTAGLKFNDMGMRNPFTKQPMLLHEPDSLVQSRNLCFPLRVVIAKDSKKTLNGFRLLYNQFNSGNVSEALDCYPIKMSYPGDMKLQWGALDKGGAAKVKEQFCYVCPCSSSTLHAPQDASKCSLCKDKEERQMQCYHYQFLASAEVRGQLEDELRVVTALVEGAAANNPGPPGEQQRMYVRQQGQVAVEGDKLDIDYQATTAIERAVFSRQVTDELASRSMNVTGSMAARQQRLRQQLLNENRVRELQHMLAHSEPRDKAMYLVLQAVVCILHLENRVGLKSIETILRSGLSNAMQGVLTWTASKGVKKRQDEYVNCVTNIIQTRILGTFLAPSQWRFPLTDDGKMGSLSMDNNRTRAMVNNIEALIEVSFPDWDPNKAKLLACFPHYRAALVILQKNTDYTDEEILKFQEHIYAWFCDWVLVYGKEGCTNYTHMLSSSHIMRYMQEWRCLHRYSQQGWEALNALLKAYFFRRTNRGGLAKNSARKSKLLGIARWLQRRMMWYSGNGDTLFSKECCDDAADEDGDDDSSHDHDDNSWSGMYSAENSEDDDNNSMFDSDDDDNEDMSIGTGTWEEVQGC